MNTATKRAESPAGNGMTIVHSAPTDHTGVPVDTRVPSVLSLVPSINGQFGPSSATPGRLSRAGLLAALAAINTYLSGLSAANADVVNNQLRGGLSVTVTPTLVTVPCAPGDAATLATSLATVLTTGGNVVAL